MRPAIDAFCHTFEVRLPLTGSPFQRLSGCDSILEEQGLVCSRSEGLDLGGWQVFEGVRGEDQEMQGGASEGAAGQEGPSNQTSPVWTAEETHAFLAAFQVRSCRHLSLVIESSATKAKPPAIHRHSCLTRKSPLHDSAHLKSWPRFKFPASTFANWQLTSPASEILWHIWRMFALVACACTVSNSGAV